jgi:type II secretory pathway component PulF
VFLATSPLSGSEFWDAMVSSFSYPSSLLWHPIVVSLPLLGVVVPPYTASFASLASGALPAVLVEIVVGSVAALPAFSLSAPDAIGLLGSHKLPVHPFPRSDCAWV